MYTDKHTKNLLKKFILNQCTKAEVEEIIAYIQKSKNSSSLPTVEEVLDLLDEKSIMVEADANRIHSNILNTEQKPEVPVIPLRKNGWFNYTAAAVVVGILASGYFFRDNIFTSPITDNTPIIVNNNIEPGIEKAILTLSDGSDVNLEKETTYQTANATSNGEEIVYSQAASKDIAYNYLTIPRGGQFQITLSDGTQVWLNSESQLKYPVNFIKGETRDVELVYGEAYFDVTSSTANGGSKFRVLNQNQEVEVLGTAFNIKAYKDEINVYTTLVEGEVAIHTEKLNKVLKPGELSNFNTVLKTIQISEVDIFREVSWKDGIFSFKHKSLKDIMVVLSRWYDMEVVFENKALENVNFNGTLYKNQSIEKILVFIKSSVNTYEINNKTIILK